MNSDKDINSINSKNSTSKQSFLFGAMILLAANFIVKIIGFIFKIPLYNLIGKEGMGYYNTAYNIYVLFYTISTAGLPVAISRMIAVSNAEKKISETRKIFKLSRIIFIALGFIGTVIMIILALTVLRDKTASDELITNYCVIAIAPTLFFVCVASSYKGYFQGNQNMIPTGISNFLEAAGKLSIGIVAALYAIKMNYSVPVVAAFAVCGLTFGSILSLVFLMIFKKLKQSQVEHENYGTMKSSASKTTRQIGSEILRISLPITFSASFLSLSGMIDTFVMKWRLESIGFSAAEANGAFGNYSTMAISFFNFPNSLIVPFAVSIIPVISAAFANNNIKVIKSTVESTFRMVAIIALPCSFGICAMSKPILWLLFNDKESVLWTAPLLSALSLSIMLVACVSITNAMLQAQRMETKTIISMASGIVIKLLASIILIGIPQIGAYGAPISTFLCYFTIMVINLYYLSRKTDVMPPVNRTFMKPFISSAVTALAAILVYKLFSMFIGENFATLVSLMFAVGVYIIMLLLLKTMAKEDVLLLPKGIKLYTLLKKHKLIE